MSGLFVYPVKSLRACTVTAAEFDACGIVHDRRFLVVDSAGSFLTQRTLPQLAGVRPEITPNGLKLHAPGFTTLPVNRPDVDATLRTVQVWSSKGLEATDCGDEAASWLSAVLDHPCRLVYAGRHFRRSVPHPGLPEPGMALAFTDAYPLLVVSEESLAALNERLRSQGEEPVPMNRFRPNIVIRGADAHAEDQWKEIRVGTVILRAAGPCARCTVVSTDQQTGRRGVEPLRTLAQYRRDPEKQSQINFGQNFRHEGTAGTLRVGDQVEVLT